LLGSHGSSLSFLLRLRIGKEAILVRKLRLVHPSYHDLLKIFICVFFCLVADSYILLIYISLLVYLGRFDYVVPFLLLRDLVHLAPRRQRANTRRLALDENLGLRVVLGTIRALTSLIILILDLLLWIFVTIIRRDRQINQKFCKLIFLRA